MRQVELAQLAGISPGQLCRIEGDADYCGDITAVRLARALDCPVEAFTAPGPHPNLSTWRRKPAAAA